MRQPISIILTDPAGLHARPASAVAAIAATRPDDEVVLRHEGRQADARSVLEMLGLGIGPGATVEIIAPDDVAQQIEAVLTAGAETVETSAPSAPEPKAATPLWTPRLVLRRQHAEDFVVAVETLGERLIELGAIERGYLDATIERERSQPTGIPAGPPFAIAHCEAPGAHRLSLALGVFETPVEFGRMDDPAQQLEVRMVALLAVPQRAHHVTALKSVIDLLANPDTAERLLTAADEQQMWRVLAEAAPDLVAENPSRWRGHAASSGLAVAPAFVLGHLADVRSEPAADPAAALRALHTVLADAPQRWRADAQVAEGEQAEILRMYATLAGDPALKNAAEEHLRAGASLADALTDAAEEHARMLENTTDAYLAARADDIRGVARALIRLASGQAADVPRGPVVVVGRSLTLLDLPAGADVAGIVDAAGSTTSHLGMVARARQIPAVFGVGPEVLSAASDGATVLVDGWTGEVDLAPAPERIERLRAQDAERRLEDERLALAAEGVTGTQDGTPIEFAANAAGIDDIVTAFERGADGIGLLRTELAFAESAQRPTLEQQQAFFRQAIGAADGRRLVVRTFDFGTDKPARFLPVAREENPALGVRGFRIWRHDPALIREQVQALVAAACEHDARNVAVMAPMIATVEEAREFRELVRAEDPEGRLDVGVMVEVPALLWMARDVAQFVDFFSIGTNDLTQYLLAADRMNPSLAELRDPDSPAVLRAVAAVCEAAREAGIWVGVCGEAAASPRWATIAVGLGVTELSVSVDRLSAVKVAVGQITTHEARHAATTALLGADSPTPNS